MRNFATGSPVGVGMIMPVIIPTVTAEPVPAPAPLPAVEDDPVRRLVAAWLLGYQSPATAAPTPPTSPPPRPGSPSRHPRLTRSPKP